MMESGKKMFFMEEACFTFPMEIFMRVLLSMVLQKGKVCLFIAMDATTKGKLKTTKLRELESLLILQFHIIIVDLGCWICQTGKA